MPVYMIIDSKVTNPACYQQYLSEVSKIVANHGGRYLARGSQITPITGNWRPERLILLEFPSEGHIREWLSSTEYQTIAPLREASTETRAVVIQGCIDQETCMSDSQAHMD